MKLYKKLIVPALAGIMLVGCEDAIDIVQPGRLDPTAALQNTEDLADFMNATYGLIDHSGEIGWTAAFTDEITRAQSYGGQWSSELLFQLDANSTISSQLWVENYRLINQANRLLTRAGELEAELTNVTDNDQDAIDAYNDVVAQARIARAYGHWTLMNYFSEDLEDDNALGVPLFDFVPDFTVQPLRNTNAEVYAAIDADLDFALANLATQSSDFFFSVDMVNALKARIANERGNYSEARSLATDLLASYSLTSTSDYALMFQDDVIGECIFKVDRVFNGPYDGQGATGSAAAGGWLGANFAFGGPGLGGSPYMEVDRGLFNLLEPGDVRQEVIIAPSSIIAPDLDNVQDYRLEDQLIVNKYRGSEGRNLMNDIKVFRASEMLFIAAEANVALGDLDAAEDLMDDLLDARFGSDQNEPDYSSATEAYQDILTQRRLELAFEGHRWKDLRRLGERANRGVDRFPLDCAFNGQCELAPSSFKFALPIPLAEIDGNPGIGDQQNPGYGN